MTSHIRLTSALALLASIVACSTTPVTPRIDKFAKATAAAMETGEKSFEASELDTRIAAVLRDEMVAKNGFYADTSTADVPCETVWVMSIPTGQDRTFNDVCKPAPVKLQVGDLASLKIALPRLEPDAVKDGQLTPAQRIIAEYNARRAIKSIKRYSASLLNLATAEEPKEVASAFSEAAASLRGLAENVTTVNDDQGISESTGKVFETGAGLIAGLTREVLEARRYKLLSEIVRTSDPLIDDLARASAVWFYDADKKDIGEKYAALNDALFANAAPSRTPADLKAVEDAAAAARKAENEARWRVFWNVAVAHHAILKSLDGPPSLELLDEANSRILTLVNTTDAFVKAVEAKKKE